MSDEKKNNPTRSSKRKKQRKINGWRLALIIILFLGIIGVGTGAGIGYSYIKDAPSLNMDNFQYAEPSIILDINGDFYQELQGTERREVVSIDIIPDTVKNAFIAIEDERFANHKGVDIRGIGQSALQGIRARDIRTAGGSTITQQLIKLTHLSPEKTFKRKIQEAYLAYQLERNMTKDQILESYLNKINFAYAHGIQAASQNYFRVDVQDLSIAQAAVLAAIPRGPSIYRPYIIEEKEDGSFGLAYEEDEETLVHSQRNKNRALTVLFKMRELEYIDDTQYNEAKNQLENNEFGLVEPQQNSIYSYFTDAVYDQVLDDIIKEYEYDREEATTFLLNAGLTIHSTINPDVQATLDKNFENDSLFPTQSSIAKQASEAKSQETGRDINYAPEGAMVIIDNSTGYVSGIVGGRNKEGSRSLNRAFQTFQPGSATKPLTVYAPGIDSRKMTLATTYDDVPIQIGNYKPGNSGGGHRGMTTVRYGLYKSLNTVAVQALYDVGFETSMEYGERFGLDFVKEGRYNDAGPGALALGGYTRGQTPLAMASAFSAFPNNGVRAEPTFYTKVEDSKGEVILENKPEKTQVISPQTAYLVTDILKDAVQGGSTRISVPKAEFAGKTGTTNSNMHAWFVGYTPQYTAAVWYGYDENIVKINANTPNEKTYHLNIGIYGGSKPGPAGMWEKVMSDLHKNLESQRFPGNPGGIVSANVDSVSGLLPSELSSKDPRGSTIISEMFISGTVPTERDNYHIELEVDISTNKLASEHCPPELIATRVFIRKPEDRFPSPVQPQHPNFVTSNEKDVLAPSEDDVCDLHSEDTLIDFEITAPTNTIKVGEQLQLSIDGNIANIHSLEFSSDSPGIEVINKNTGLIIGMQQGDSVITATATFKYKTRENGEKVEREYTRTSNIIIKVEEHNEDIPDPPEEIHDDDDDEDAVEVSDDIQSEAEDNNSEDNDE